MCPATPPTSSRRAPERHIVPPQALRPAKRVSTSDGYEIAFQPQGTGPCVLVLFPYHVSDVELCTLVPPHRRGLAFLSAACTVVPLDLRGSGQSTRACGPLRLEAFSRDLEAVRQAMSVARVSVCAVGAAALVAFAYAARHRGRVSRLVCVQAGASEANRRLLSVRRASPAVEARLRAHALAGVHGAGTVGALAASARAALLPEQLAGWEHLLDTSDLLAWAREVAVPALCVHAADDDLVPLDAARALASTLPHGRLHAFRGRTGLDLWDDVATMHIVRAFLAEGRLPAATPGTRSSPALSERELAVLHLLAAGRTNREIAIALGISVHTVSFHVRGIFGKTGAANRTEAAAHAHRRGLLE